MRVDTGRRALGSIALQETLAAEAARAPSVHNIQPARWRFTRDGALVLFRSLDRELPAADPTGRDVQASLGAAFEGMAIALSTRGIELGVPEPESREAATGCAPVFRADLIAGAESDGLAPFVEQRRSWRGLFVSRSAADVAALTAMADDDVRVVHDVHTIDEAAKLHDRATWAFGRQPGIQQELWSWLRLSPKDPRYRRDGLTADCLLLSPPERQAARVLMRPRVFAALRFGAAQMLVSEAAQVRCAHALMLFCPRHDEPAFDFGRRFYRVWLTLTSMGFHAAPMSAVADSPVSNAILTGRAGIPGDRRLVSVLRVGRVAGAVPVSPRLPPPELLV